MLSRPQLRLFSIFALLVAVTNATWLDANVYQRGLNARQQASGSTSGTPATGTGEPSAAAVTPSSSSIREEPTPTPTPTPSPTPSPSSSSVIIPPSTTPPSVSPSATPTSSPSATPSSSAASTPTRTSSPPQDSSSPTEKASSTKTTAKVTPTPTTFVVVNTVVRTESGSTFSSLASSTVTSTLPTGTAALNSDGTPKSTGMSSKTRNTIIGVVVGIGGAILLAGLGVVAFRIWGRRKNSDESDGLMSFGNTGHEKTGSSSATGTTGASPFTSTLENYHNPARNGNVNASSNF
ncbi:hypothetical protein VTL71DRAFT_4334 [Oculimacula yallundae]|uniref:Mid2 domain-containing protein n=1 Tax=Oculimacula yallundae TaxID=86028 RepID=A0ABR4C1Q0_9HELO